MNQSPGCRAFFALSVFALVAGCDAPSHSEHSGGHHRLDGAVVDPAAHEPMMTAAEADTAALDPADAAVHRPSTAHTNVPSPDSPHDDRPPGAIAIVFQSASAPFPTPPAATLSWRLFANDLSGILGDANLPVADCLELSRLFVNTMIDAAKAAVDAKVLQIREGSALPNSKEGDAQAVALIRRDYSLKAFEPGFSRDAIKQLLAPVLAPLALHSPAVAAFMKNHELYNELIDLYADRREVFLFVAISQRPKGWTNGAPVFSLEFPQNVHAVFDGNRLQTPLLYTGKKPPPPGTNLFLVFPRLNCLFPTGRTDLAHPGLFSIDVARHGH